MGKQIAVVMLDEDEEDFLSFVRSTAEIELIESSAPSRGHLFVERMLPREQGHWAYYIWNKAFSWQPELKQVAANAIVTNRRDWFYVANHSVGPLLEYTRHNFSPRGVQGRI